MIATAIITAPRPVPTLQHSIMSWRHAGFTGVVHVFADGLPGIVGTLLEVHENNPPLGNLRNWHRALSTIYHDTDADWLMVCEDDITWCPGARDALEQDLRGLHKAMAMGKVGGLSLYLPRRHYKGLAPLERGWHSQGLQKGKGAWGAQCLLFTRPQARSLLGDLQFDAFLSDSRWNKNVDAIVSRCINDRGLDLLYRVPCLVNHSLGDGNSSLGYKPDRPDLQTDYYTGQP